MKWLVATLTFSLALGAFALVGSSSCEQSASAEGPACHPFLLSAPSVPVDHDGAVPAATKIVVFAAIVAVAIVSVARPNASPSARVRNLLHLAFPFATRLARSDLALLRPA